MYHCGRARRTANYAPGQAGFSPCHSIKLSRIVDFVDQLSQADTENVVPMAHPLHASQRLRPDKVTEPNDRDHVQENAPLVEHGLYLVPKVIE